MAYNGYRNAVVDSYICPTANSCAMQIFSRWAHSKEYHEITRIDVDKLVERLYSEMFLSI